MIFLTHQGYDIANHSIASLPIYGLDQPPEKPFCTFVLRDFRKVANQSRIAEMKFTIPLVASALMAGLVMASPIKPVREVETTEFDADQAAFRQVGLRLFPLCSR
jgi:hypothetical protein